MFKNAFEKLELEDVAVILDRLNPEFDGSIFDPVNTTIMAADLSFYKGYRLLEVADHSVMPPLLRFTVYRSTDFKILNFSNVPIYKLNKDAPIKITKENIGEYVRFFFTYVRGKHGRFLVCENVDDIAWREDPPPVARKAIGKMITPLTVENIDDDGVYHLQFTMIFKDSLFRSKAKVTPGGLITLHDEELLVEDIPVIDDTLGL